MAEQAAKANAAITENEQAKQAHDALSPGFQAPLFGCLSEGPVPCLVSCCCAPVVLGMITAQMDDRECTPCDCLLATPLYQLRQRIRSMHSIEYAPLQDCAVSTCCVCVSVHQTAIEWKNRSGKEPEWIKMPDRYS
eukprot:scaffold241_cov242-Pinguiococcus_pyrenoidosus.AAC.11